MAANGAIYCNGAASLAEEETTVSVRLDARGGKEIARIETSGGEKELSVPLTGSAVGKHAVYFVFSTKGKARMDCFTFD